jgi:hypothetical protein
VRADRLNESGITDGSWDVAPIRQQPGWLEHIDLPVNDFALLAAIGPILLQFSVASRQVSRQFARGLLTVSSEFAGEHARFKRS